jgi:choline dehydrogenase-like flavoprotein
MAESGNLAAEQTTTGRPIEADYLIIGAGAAGMAFADTLLSETEATIALVDRRHRPGGHRNDAYPYVRLHQPSAYYGVNSWPLGSGEKDETGLNKGFYELASGLEVLNHFDQVLRRRFLPSGQAGSSISFISRRRG